MHKSTRKRPWEKQDQTLQGTAFDTFLHQLILCTFITIGIFVALYTDNNHTIKQVLTQEISKNIELEDLKTWMKTIVEYFN